jgi:hypothetical protein
MRLLFGLRTTVSLLLITFGLATPALYAQAASERVALVELFTSEGCSSCPPADALLRALHGTRTAEGVRIIGLSEHVTYWNQLGWRDPFSSDLFTQRQDAYASRFRLDSVYTPQVVVNGAAQVLGSSREAILRAVHTTTATAPGATLRLVSIKQDGENVQIRFTAQAPPGQPANAKAPVLLAAITDDTDITQVPRGENGGRTLTHVSVVRALQEVGRGWSAEPQTASLTLPAGKASPRHIVLFATDPDVGRVLAVIAAPLG